MQEHSWHRRASDILEQGYTVFERLHDDVEVTRCRAALERRHAELGSPRCFANPPVALASDIEQSQSGIVFNRLLHHHPDFGSLIAHPDVVATMRLLLGERMQLELTSAVVADASRTFFSWHNHIGGPDQETIRKIRPLPTFERSLRLMTLTYLDDLDAQSGPLLAYPRRISDPTEAPYDLERQDWPGLVEFHIPRGSVVLMDQCTWHAVRQKVSTGLRILVGAWFRSGDAPKTQHVDESLQQYAGDHALLKTLLPSASGGLHEVP